MLDLTSLEGFDWDDGNSRKSTDKHSVSQAEAEQVFFNDPLLLFTDVKHSTDERRYHALGRTDDSRLLQISFTLRGGGRLVRVISARDMSRKEKESGMNRKLKPIPRFRDETEERHFWETHDSSDYIDWSKAERARFPNLKPSTTSISLRLPLTLLERIKIAANKRDMPYQSLIKAWLAEKLDTKR
jgi:uncharacterized DUF497 family protein